MSFLRENWGELFSVFHLISAFRGGKVPDNAPPAVKALAKGVGRIGDEVAFNNLLLDLNTEDWEIIQGFIQYHFLRHKGRAGRIIAWFQLNKWRTLITELDPPSQRGTRKVETKSGQSKGGNASVTTEDILLTPETKQAKLFLERIVTIVRNAQSAGKDRNTGYEKVVEYFESFGVPTMPDDVTIAWIEQHLNVLPDVSGWVTSHVTSFEEYLQAEADAIDARRAARPPIVRLLMKLIGG